MNSGNVVVRPATSADIGVIVDMIRALAAYEGLDGECAADEAPLSEHLFGPRPQAEVLIADAGGSVIGFALFLQTYSTFLAMPGLWVEDLFVTPEHRGVGVGGALLTRVAEIAIERGCGRMEWSVLDSNQPAVAFYRRLGAELMNEWTTCRLDKNALRALAAPDE